jgi:hypothetical protein
MRKALRVSLFFSMVLLFCSVSQAQFVKGVGIMGGAVYSNQKFLNNELPYKRNQGWRFGGTGSVFMEYIDHSYIRMISEVQFMQMGSRTEVPFPAASRQNYISWGQWLKFRQELYDVTPYFLFGPKYQFLFSSNVPDFKMYHFGAYAALGMEFLYKRPWIFLVELGYDNDITNSRFADKFETRNKAFVLRAGLYYEIKRKAKGCRTRPGVMPTLD